MLMKERKIIENLTIKEELLLFWIRENHIPPPSANMALLTHSGRPMAPKDNFQTSQDGLMIHHPSVHSELVTYQSKATIEQSDQTAHTSKTQLKIL